MSRSSTEESLCPGTPDVTKSFMPPNWTPAAPANTADVDGGNVQGAQRTNNAVDVVQMKLAWH